MGVEGIPRGFIRAPCRAQSAPSPLLGLEGQPRHYRIEVGQIARSGVIGFDGGTAAIQTMVSLSHVSSIASSLVAVTANLIPMPFWGNT